MREAWSNAALAIFVLMHFVCALALWKKRNDYADIVWGPGFVVAGLAAFSATSDFGMDARKAVALALVVLWAARLFSHIGFRNLTHSNEDSRYANWRKEWGATWIWRSYLQVFVLQGLLLLIVDASFIWILGSAPTEFDLFAALGVVVWLFGFAFEAIGDEQLRRFKNRPGTKGLLMTEGLWSWTRHPNYFGEVVQWWGIYLIAVGVPGGWVTIFAPMTITFLILKVSGVPMLEAQMKDRAGFAEYAARTSAFIPLPPRKS